MHVCLRWGLEREGRRSFQTTLGTSIAAESPSPQHWDSLTSHSISAPFSLIQLLTNPSTGLCPVHPASQPFTIHPTSHSFILKAAISQWEAKAFVGEKPYCFHPCLWGHPLWVPVTEGAHVADGITALLYRHLFPRPIPSPSFSLLLLSSFSVFSFFSYSFSFSTPHALGSPWIFCIQNQKRQLSPDLGELIAPPPSVSVTPATPSLSGAELNWPFPHWTPGSGF